MLDYQTAISLWYSVLFYLTSKNFIMKIEKKLLSPEEIEKRKDEFTTKNGTDPTQWPKYEDLAHASSESTFEPSADTIEQSCSLEINYSIIGSMAPVPIAFLSLHSSSDGKEDDWEFNGNAMNLNIGGEISGQGTLFFDDATELHKQDSFTVLFNKDENTVKVSWGSTGYALFNLAPIYLAPLKGNGGWKEVRTR